jgi:hypothetical protein
MKTTKIIVLSLFTTGLFIAFQNFSSANLVPVTPAPITGTCNLPVNVSRRIGRALTWGPTGSTGIYRSQLPGSRDIIWGDSADGLKFAQVFSARYLPYARDPNKDNGTVAYTDGTYCSEYFNSNTNAYDPRPEQVLYRENGQPAFSFAYSGTVAGCAPGGTDTSVTLPNYYKTPLDISNFTVRYNQFCKNVSPFFATDLLYNPNGTSSHLSCATYFPPPARPTTKPYTGFDGISLDNVAPWNGYEIGGASGAYGIKLVAGQNCPSGVISNGICQKYTGVRVDPVFSADVADYVGWFASQAHYNNHKCVLANLKYHDDYQSSFNQVVSSPDIIVWEGGFTKNTGGTSCVPAAATLNTARDPAAWTDMMSNYLNITNNPAKAFVILDGNCRLNGKLNLTFQNWTMANYLLIKGNHTYLTYEEDDFPADTAQLYLPIGAPTENMQSAGGLYWRHFENALAVVNPSATGTVTYNFGSEVWYDTSGTLYHN